LKYKHIIFDFDGVIVDTEKYFRSLKIKYLTKIYFKFKNKKNISETLDGYSFNDLINKLKFIKNPKKISCIKKEYNKEKREIYRKKIKINSYFLNILKGNKKLVFYIVSNRSKNNLIKTLKELKIKKFFKNKNIISYYKFKSRKPDPSGYKFVLSLIPDKELDKSLVIEDSISGIIAAQEAGFENILRFSSKKNGSQKEIKNIKTFKELQSIL